MGESRNHGRVRERVIMTAYRSTTYLPPLVQKAMALADHCGFEHSCLPAVGRLLRVLAGQVRGGLVGEIGTGCGVGAAWMVSALPPGARFMTVELDQGRASAARLLFENYKHVQVLQGDWHDILAHGPFDLLFADTKAKQHEPELLLEALRPGGLIVLDDLTPEEHWPAEWRGQPDSVRRFWLNDARLAATEVLVAPTMNVIVATRQP